MQIPSHISSVLDILSSNGFEGYLVGGCVRDAMMGEYPHDFDIATNATPEEMLLCFSDHRIIETGLKHGTVTVVSDGENVEITTYRIDGEYLDNRRPKDVSFTRNLSEDLSRRDFTINALAYSIKDGLCDMFNGMDDLKARLIRCVGNPDTRFGEDALRIMRALRFSSTLGFDIHEETSKSIFSNMHLLSNISCERIYSELKKLICGNDASSVIVKYSDVFFSLFPWISSNKNLFISNAQSLSQLPVCHTTRLASLLWGYDEDAVTKFMTFLKCDNDTLHTVQTLCSFYDKDLLPEKIAVRRLMSVLDDDVLLSLAHIKHTHSGEFLIDDFLSVFYEQKKNKSCVRLSQLAITGNELIAFGIPRGPKIGEMLQKILDAVIEEKCENSFLSIIAFCARYK